MTSLILIPALFAVQGGNIRTYTQPNLRDFSFVADVKVGNQGELKKIGKDFGLAYTADDVTIRCKDTFKLRGEMRFDDTTIIYIENRNEKAFQVPHLPRKKENVANAPGKQQNVFDFGLLTPDLFETFMDAKFVRNDRATGDAVFDVTYNPKYNDTSRYRIWIDPARKIITKKEWFGQDGNLRATFTFDKPSQVNGLWVPTEATVINAEGKLAGRFAYTRWKVNSGLPDSLFKV